VTGSTRDLLRTAGLAWVTARALVGISAAIVGVLETGDRGPYHWFDRGLLAWDGDWYRAIAENGYRLGEEEIRFFPLFPLLGRIVGLPFLDNASIGLVIVANAMALAASLMIGTLALKITDNLEIAHRSIWLVSLWPASFVLVFAYGEALFLVLTAWAGIALRDRRWGHVAAAGFLATLTRPTGLAIALLVVAVVLSDGRMTAREGARQGLALIAPFLGFAVFGMIATREHGEFFAPVDSQEVHRGEFVDPLRRLLRGFEDIVGDEMFGDGLHLPFALVAIVGVVLLARYVGRPEAIYTGAIVLVAISADNWNSLERYTLNAYPVMIGFAAFLTDLNRILLWRATIVASSAGLVGMTVLTWTGEYVP
jgi:hypothetical protein